MPGDTTQTGQPLAVLIQPRAGHLAAGVAEALPAVRLRESAARLEALIAARRRAPFRWGEHDCALFAADAVEALLGVDIASAWRGTYASEEEAAALLAPVGGLRGVAEATLGPAVSPLLARVGDVGLVVDEARAWREALAVCAGQQWLVPGLRGLELVPMAAAVAAWRVGG